MKLYLKKLIDSGKAKDAKGQLIRGAFGIGGLKILSIPLAMIASILLARYLGPEGYGKYSFVMALIALLSLPVGGGIKQLIIREVASYEHEKSWGLLKGSLKKAHQFVGILSVVIILGVFSFLIYKANWELTDKWTLLAIATLALPFMGFNQIRTGALRGLGSIVNAQIPELIVQPGLHLVNIAILVFIGFLNPATAIVSQVVAILFAFMIGSYLLSKKTPAEIRTIEPLFEIKKWAGALVPFTLLVAASIFNNQIGIILLGWLGTDAEVGALSVAAKGAQLISFSLIIVNMAISPYIAKYFKENNRDKLQKLSRQSARAALVFALPIALPMIVFGGFFIKLIFGKEYVELSVLPLAILAASQLINVVAGSVGMFLTMCGFEKETLIGQVIALITNAILAVLLIPHFGANGAAIAAATGMVIWNIILAYKFKKHLKINPSAI